MQNRSKSTTDKPLKISIWNLSSDEAASLARMQALSRENAMLQMENQRLLEINDQLQSAYYASRNLTNSLIFKNNSFEKQVAELESAQAEFQKDYEAFKAWRGRVINVPAFYPSQTGSLKK